MCAGRRDVGIWSCTERIGLSRVSYGGAGKYPDSGAMGQAFRPVGDSNVTIYLVGKFLV